MENKPELSSQYPSIDLAYEMIKSSYEVMESRFNAANSRIQNILTWAVGITAIIPLFAKVTDGKANFISPWFILVLVAFFTLMVIGIFAHRMDGVKLVSPEIIYNKYISRSGLEFKKQMVYWSGKHFNTNQRFINRKSIRIDIMTGLLGLEIVLAFVWVIVT